ncbi:antibiotic biosynthesis monooxygenase family protein [Agrilutibacter solisilvae]|uniref:Antibiotic biosynthesis monooxygenase n=1 Tax=Agrilutibacter solisilvae TaxID=2763317 RepID=A0A974Y2X3_9GAMM|nr:antibiotic biosynthesis monooxygenase [Lysobacter solisilvae]QSX79625.1 antibiotic biosynthesis monooxygenase [Lysobacter solisilvae]
MTSPFAQLPEPPYYAVIFSSLRNGDDDAGYQAAAERMVALASQQPGFLGVETVRGADGFGITVSYWESEAAILAWKHQADHAATRAHGRRHWYEYYELRVSKVTRAYGKPAPRENEAV